MQRILNEADCVVEEMLEGFLKCHSDIVVSTENKKVVKYKYAPIENKVGIVTGGGSGHKPAFIGYIGDKLVDAVAVGEIFSSPTAKAFYDAIVSADSGKGVAVLYGNYSGDNMNVKMAVKMALRQGINVKTVVANDDVPSASMTEREKRRGVAGEILMWKIAGALSAKGADLDEVIRLAQKAIDHTRSIGVGLAPCVLPSNSTPNFAIEEGTIEYGIGHHGEKGIEVARIEKSRDMAEKMCKAILEDFGLMKPGEVVVLVSGLGATPLLEQYVFYNNVEECLRKENVTIAKSYVGNLFTSIDMKGVTLTIMGVDSELRTLVLTDCYSMHFKQR